MGQCLLLITLFSLLAACGSPPRKPDPAPNELAAALVTGSKTLISQHRAKHQLSVRNNNVINLYLLTLDDQPYQVINHSQALLNNWHHYSPAQQAILQPILLWAYAHPIYRQETAKQVRLLQRETLLLAPSKIDFERCEVALEGCAHQLRNQVSPRIIHASALTETLIQMADNDPCINLSDENVGGNAANNCLTNRKGDLKINLLSRPQYLQQQWLALLKPKPTNTP